VKKLNLTIAERKQKRRYLFMVLAVMAAMLILFQVTVLFNDTWMLYTAVLAAIGMFVTEVHLWRKLAKLQKVAKDRDATKEEVLP
jgi:hypothetical protein